ncbi:MAG: hypothetical protein Q6J78_04050 [Thermostichales cyanobacterium SRBZ-1_bins_19]
MKGFWLMAGLWWGLGLGIWPVWGQEPTFQLDLRQQFQVAPEQSTLERPQFTGLIVDARGLDFEPSMSMRLFDPQGRQIYTTTNPNQELNTSYVASEGTAAYATSPEQAKALTNRIGDRPHIVRAQRTRGYDLILSAQDAAFLEQANQRDRFLDHFRVVVIWDPPTLLRRPN